MINDTVGLPKHWKTLSKQERPNNFLTVFFDKKSPYYLGDLKHMPKMLCGHSYNTHSTPEQLKDVRMRLNEKFKKYGVEFQQSEWCLLPGFNAKNQFSLPESWNQGNRADVNVGIMMALLIYSDLAHADSTAWGYWKAMEIKGDHALISVFPKDGDFSKGGVACANKLLWALGNYSRFIRPDYTRISLSGADNLKEFVGSAYISKDGKTIVAVLVNPSNQSVSRTFDFGKSDSAISDIQIYRTDASCDLANVYSGVNKNISFPARSVSTMVVNLK